MKIRRFIILPLLVLFFASCNNEITDFFKFIADRGYEFQEPLSNKYVPVDDRLLGGYIYESLPVIISKKDNFTYEISFLHTELGREDRIIEAHMTKFGSSQFLNLNMGSYYSVVRVNLEYNQEFKMNLIRSSLRRDMSPEDLKKFLRKNPEKNKILYSEMPPKKVEKRPDGWPPDRPEVEEVRRPDEEAEIYYTVSFSKITVDAAREKQEKVLYDKKAKLFEECYSYRRYEELTEKYPLDELFFSAEQSLFNMCKTIEDYTQFVRYFPNSTLIREAQIQIARIREEQKRKEMIKKDSLAYQFALSESTIESFEVFLQNRNTNVFKDSAYLQIKDLAEKITQQDIEWKWTSGEVQSALNFIYYRIDYSDSITDAPWLVDNLSFYAMTKGSEDDKTKAISYLGKIAKHLDGREDYLNLYLEKGFLLWASGKTDLAVSNFDLRIGEAYDDGTSVKSMLKTKYKAYQKEGVVFPEAKPTWKRIKKLK